MAQYEFIIVGGGIIGLSLGWRLRQGGASVTIFERDQAGRAASWQAGGMLAPSAEVGFEEVGLYHFGRESLQRWPSFAAELEAESDISVDYRREGTLVVADDRDSAEALHRLYEFQKSQDVPVQWLKGYEAIELEPFLAPGTTAAIFCPDDHQVDNQRVVEALKVAFLRRGGVLREKTSVQRLSPAKGKPGVVLENGEEVYGDAVVLCAGCWSRAVEGLSSSEKPPVRPVKGQMIELRMEKPFELRHVVRGPGAYLAPKSDGRLIVGATSEEMGFDTRVTAGGIYAMLEAAWEIVPGIYDLEMRNTYAGLRPGSRDHQPILGWSTAPGIAFATGHYRHGVLLTPVTADEVSRLLLGGETSHWIAPFAPSRFVTETEERHAIG